MLEINTAETVCDVFHLTASINHIAVADILKVLNQWHRRRHNIEFVANMPATMKPSALPFDDANHGFVNIVRPGYNDFPRAFTDHMAKKVLPIFVKMLHHNLTGLLRRLSIADLSIHGSFKSAQDGLVLFRAQLGSCALVVPPLFTPLGTDSQGTSKSIEDSLIPLSRGHTVLEQ